MKDKLRSFLDFRDEFYQRLPMPGREVYVPKTDSKTKVKLGALVRSIGYVGRLEDYVDMPEQVFKTEYVQLTTEQSKRIKEVQMEWPDPLTKALKTHCIENGVLVGDEFNDGEFFKNQKLDRLLEYAEEFPRMLVFARYRAQIDQAAAAMKKAGKKVFVLTGDTKDRGKLIEEAKRAKEYVFFCQSQVSAGWELPECPVVVFLSLDFSLVNLVQAQGRISRINNPKRNLYVYLVLRGGVDQRVYDTVVGTKMDFHLATYK